MRTHYIGAGELPERKARVNALADAVGLKDTCSTQWFALTGMFFAVRNVEGRRYQLAEHDPKLRKNRRANSPRLSMGQWFLLAVVR